MEERRDAATAGPSTGGQSPNTSAEAVARRRPDRLYAHIIEHLEKGEPDRSLDWEIHCRDGLAGVGSYGQHPEYTASIDDALMLVPRHHLWELRHGFEARAIVWMIETDYDDRDPPTGYTTEFPAIALCIAALKASAEVKAR